MKCNRENLILQFFLFGEKEQDLIISKQFYSFILSVLFWFVFNLFWNICKKIIYVS